MKCHESLMSSTFCPSTSVCARVHMCVMCMLSHKSQQEAAQSDSDNKAAINILILMTERTCITTLEHTRNYTIVGKHNSPLQTRVSLSL